MKKRFTLGSMALLAALLGVVLITVPALAHEKRHVGPYTFVVGFLDEPAYANVKNSLDLTVCDGSSCTYTVQNAAQVLSNPVNDVNKTLKVEVSTGGSAPLALTLEPRYANPGKYTAYFLPTRVGDYTFHFFGTINNNHIDEKFTSSPTGFSPVGQVPTYPSGSADPANAQFTALKNQAQSAQNSATTAMTISILGAIFGLLGLVTAGLALARKPRYAGASATEIKIPPDSLRG